MKKDSVQYKGKWHTSVDNDIIRNVELSFPARFLWILLKSYASPSSPVPYPGFETLAHFMSSFRKDRHTKRTERKRMDEDTLRKYRQELVNKGFLVVERIRNGFAEWENNRYVLLDGDPHRENPGLAKSVAGRHPGRCRTGAKDVPLFEEETSEAKSNQQQQYRASGDGAGDAVVPTPSAVKGPRSSAETFIKNFKEWGKEARITATVIPAERTALQEFFTDNPEITPYELFALMLCAWIVPVDLKVEGTDYNPFWHCNQKSKRIASFLEFLPKIQEETHWTAKMTDKQYRLAQERFLQQKAA